MEFEISAFIERAPGEVFVFLRDVYKLPRHDDPLVPVYDKVTPGPVGVGTRFREVVRMAPFYTFEILSEVTAICPGRFLAYDWKGPGMHGDLAYRIEAMPGGTRLEQRQTLIPTGLLRICAPLIGRAFSGRIAERIQEIKTILEGA
jgi:hypothetical protein